MDEKTYGTSGGVPITDELCERLAAEAEQGYVELQGGIRYPRKPRQQGRVTYSGGGGGGSFIQGG